MVTKAMVRSATAPGPWCAQCRAGGDLVDADWYVEGSAWTSGASRLMPYRAHLCQQHKMLLEEEGAKWRRTTRYAPAR